MKLSKKNIVSFPLEIRCSLNKQEYRILNQKIDTFLYEDYPVFEDDFLFEERLCNIIIENLYPMNNKNKVLFVPKKKISIKQMINYGDEFLKILNSEYSTSFNQILEEKQMRFEITGEKSYFDSIDNSFQIRMYNNISDVFTIVHEFLHSTNTKEELLNPTTSYYTECFSILGEFLVKDYLSEKYIQYRKDAQKVQKNNFISIYQDNLCFKVILEILKKKINGIEISEYQIFDIMNILYQYQPDLNLIKIILDEIISEILEVDNKYSFEDAYTIHARNTVGLILASYMYELKDKDIWNLNDHLYQLEVADVISYLNLEFNSERAFDLTEDSYKKLEKSYKDNLKRLW